MDLENRKREMYAMIAEWRGTGLSQTAWCKQVSVSRSTFRKWLRKYEDEHGIQVEQPAPSPDPSFVSIELPSSVGSQLTISYPNGVQLSCPVGIGHDQLRYLVHLLD